MRLRGGRVTLSAMGRLFSLVYPVGFKWAELEPLVVHLPTSHTESLTCVKTPNWDEQLLRKARTDFSRNLNVCQYPRLVCTSKIPQADHHCYRLSFASCFMSDFVPATSSPLSSIATIISLILHCFSYVPSWDRVHLSMSRKVRLVTRTARKISTEVGQHQTVLLRTPPSLLDSL